MTKWQYIAAHETLPGHAHAGTVQADTLPEATAYAICAHRRLYGAEPTDLRVWQVETVPEGRVA